MTDKTDSTQGLTASRAILATLGLSQLSVGLLALGAPRSFYDDFPFGRGWVAELPGFNEHLIRDVGGLFLVTAAVLIAAAWSADRRLIRLAAASFLLFSIPHSIFHLLNLEPYSTGDSIANAVTLGATVIGPLVVLALLRSPTASAPKRSGPARGGERIDGVGDRSRNPLVRYAFRDSRRRTGEVMDPIRVHAHAPGLLLGYGMFELATERSRLVEERIKHLAVMRAAMMVGCEWCLDFGSAVSSRANVSEEDLRALPEYESSQRFDQTEKLVLDYATAISRSPVDVPDQLFNSLRERFDDGQLVELTSLIALENYRARFNWAFDLGGQGYSEGGYCLRPANRQAS